jgi:HEAT repeat protein
MPLIRSDSERTATGAHGDSGNFFSSSSDERWAAARAAATTAASVPALSAALAKEDTPHVREAIFTSLARIATSESVQAVLPYLRSDAADIRTGALDALRAMPAVTVPHLPRLLADPDVDVRLLACDLVRAAQGADASRLLRSVLENESQANVCAAAVEVIAEVGDITVLPALAICAKRFQEDSFLTFAIEIASQRLRAQSPGSRD